MKRFFEKDIVWAFLFIFPSFAGTIIFILIPVLVSFGFSLLKWNLISTPHFVGLENYKLLFQEETFGQVLLNTFYYSLSVAVLGVIIPLFLAVILNKKIKGAGFFKTAYFIPFITPMIVVALVWQWIFDPNYGLFNYFFNLNIKWLYDSRFAMPALIMVSVWKNTGYNMIIFLAGLQNISESLFEAATIDGASGFRKFFFVTLPLLSPSIFFVSIITTISSFQVFDLIYLMTEGGPQNSTNVLVYWLYQNAFEFFNIGKASAIAYVLFAIILSLTLIQWVLRKKWVFNE